LELVRDGKIKVFRSRRDKGHQKEIALTLQAIRDGQTAPIPFEELVEVTCATFAIEESISSGKAVRIHPWRQSEPQVSVEQLFAS
jgi:hypothetical protein